jgi:hypothetical protein
MRCGASRLAISRLRLECMRADDLTREQARALKNKLQPMLGYLSRLKRRMMQRGFLDGDPLLDAVVNAANAMHALSVEADYLTMNASKAEKPPTVDPLFTRKSNLRKHEKH